MKVDKNFVLFITGGASGLGKAAVQHFLRKGARVAITDVNSASLEQLAKDVTGIADASNFLIKQCDVTKELDVEKAIEETVSKFGSLQGTLPCAGILRDTTTLRSETQSSDDYQLLKDNVGKDLGQTLDTDAFREVINVNLLGSVYTAKYASLAMSKNTPNEIGERGSILFVSSVCATEGGQGTSAYSASKGALNGLLMPMARDLGKFGIRVNSVAPYTFRTPLVEQLPQASIDYMESLVPLNRLGDPDKEFGHFCQCIFENSYANANSYRLDGGAVLPHF